MKDWPYWFMAVSCIAAIAISIRFAPADGIGEPEYEEAMTENNECAGCAKLTLELEEAKVLRDAAIERLNREQPNE